MSGALRNVLATSKQNKYFNFYRFFTLNMNTSVNQFSLLTQFLGNCYGLQFPGDAERHERQSAALQGEEIYK